ncbi:hypothetical protein [Skermania piniformis]|uniref:Haemin-degrading HemS/ChuX domain-containing protein n=1 Tax=Skermania pinensis TaxID=39122 RepID=A0ABX8S8K7_9ACTN|nr:hypothetical protein [Skermania piniformis]QXQ14159.1 hypothetical protein KV203_01550 [Skermania piniformis]
MCTDGFPCRCCAARTIDAGPRAVAAALSALGTVVSVTANDAALLSHTGEYQPAALPGEALVCGADQIALRVHPAAVQEISVTTRALTLSGDPGTHRAYFTPLSDGLVITALEAAPPGYTEIAEPVDWPNHDWRGTDQITHLDALTSERYNVLPFTGARQVAPRTVPYLLSHLTDIGLPFTTAVPGGGCVQLHRGPAALVERAGEHVAAVFGAARYVLMPAAIAECWVTSAHGGAGTTTAVELYDHDHRCVTVLTQTGAICRHVHDAWEQIAASLPA